MQSLQTFWALVCLSSHWSSRYDGDGVLSSCIPCILEKRPSGRGPIIITWLLSWTEFISGKTNAHWKTLWCWKTFLDDSAVNTGPSGSKNDSIVIKEAANRKKSRENVFDKAERVGNSTSDVNLLFIVDCRWRVLKCSWMSQDKSADNQSIPWPNVKKCPLRIRWAKRTWLWEACYEAHPEILWDKVVGVTNSTW